METRLRPATFRGPQCDGHREDSRRGAGFQDMTVDRLRPLTNDGWGFDSSCFVCEPRNAAGLQIPFHHDVAAQRVVAEFSLDERFSGAPQYVHGGVSLAILDEVMAWAAIAIAGRFAVTTETTSRFERPVKIDRDHTVRAWIDDVDGRLIRTCAEIVDARDRRCVTSAAVFTSLDVEQAGDAAGVAITGDAAAYTTRSS